MKVQRDSFHSIYMQRENSNIDSIDSLYIKMVDTPFDMLLMQANHAMEFIETEISRLEYISKKRQGSDSDDII